MNMSVQSQERGGSAFAWLGVILIAFAVFFVLLRACVEVVTTRGYPPPDVIYALACEGEPAAASKPSHQPVASLATASHRP